MAEVPLHAALVRDPVVTQKGIKLRQWYGTMRVSDCQTLA